MNGERRRCRDVDNGADTDPTGSGWVRRLDEEREEGEMGKGAESWDDSTPVDAFNQAIGTYNAMHGKNNKAAPSEKEIIICRCRCRRNVSTESGDEDGTIPCVTLILGGNLTKGVGKTMVSRWVIAVIVCVRYVILPVVGVVVVKSAREVGFLPPDPLYQYMLMLQFALPPAMSIGTMAQLYDVAQEECSVIFLWTYLVAALALTVWSTIFMSILA